MKTKYRYAVLGAGQGAATAYDLARFGNASQVILVDKLGERASMVASHINGLLGKNIVLPIGADVSDSEALKQLIQGSVSVVGAVSFKVNLALSKLAIDIGAHYIDLGGNTDVVIKQHALDAEAKERRVSIVPDCGMGPGLNLSLANAAGRMLRHPLSLSIYCGGLPQKPEGLLNYALFFSIEGLVNEYTGETEVISGGEIVRRQTLGGGEFVNLGGELGILEAARTLGALSTAPWTYPDTFKGLQTLEYKTLRYPCHWDHIRAWQEQGVLREELERHLGTELSSVPDVGVIRVVGVAKDCEKVVIDVLDYRDEQTGFSAMQRLTGFHASVVAILAAKGRIPRGVVPVESINGNLVIREMRKRGISVEIKKFMKE